MKKETVLITGASSGIGKEFAYQFAALGKNLIISARSEEVLKDIAKDIREKHSVEVNVIGSDLSVPGSTKRLYEEVIASGFMVDVLVNNAGFGKWGHFHDNSIETYGEMIRLNVMSLTELTALFLPAMKERNSGGVINVASTGGLLPVPYATVYAATKAFVVSFSESLYGELIGSGVTVTCLCPAGTKSNFAKVAGDTKPDRQKFLDDTDMVVRVGIEAFYAGKSTVATGKDTPFQLLLTRILPRSTVITIAGNVFRKVVFGK